MMINIINNLAFPLRAVFMGDKGKLGLISLREERMRFVARFCKGRTLDVGCGPDNLFIKNFIGEKNGIGIDVFPYKGVENIVKDMTKIPFKNNFFDTITLIAAVSHIPRSKRIDEFAEFSRLLRPGGKLVLTEGEPFTQILIHKWEELRKTGLDYERGMEEGEEYCVPRKELLGYLNTPPLRFVKRVSFMWGLNNVYIAQKNE
ncbi:MAG: class I SAM-dependent methyltransferase [Candidatus Pacebacteria bacterium]|nr:class I SAM-dependent methyltransferase [Candidatus Paceibacterota bacterium]